MNQHRMPSPAILVAVLALVAALAGTALAGTGATTSAINKKKVKKIADRRIAKAAPGLSVASAKIADTAANAQALGGRPASAFATPTSYRIEQTNKNIASLAPGTTNSVEASCDPGEHLTGGGGESSTGGLVMKEGWPVFGQNTWSVQFYNATSATLTTPQIIAFAICASP